MRRTIRFILMLVILLLLPIGATSAQQQVDGNPTCAEYGFNYEFKIDPPVSTIATADDLEGLLSPAELTVIVAGDNLSFDWSTNFEVGMVIAKGGNEGANLYPGGFSGIGLQVPTGQELSHISICYNMPPGVDIEKATNGEDADEPTGPEIVIGDPVVWTYEVTNTGNVPLEFSVSDSQGVEVSCPTNVVGVGETVVCTASGVAIEGQYQNLGRVTTNYDISDEDPSHYIGVEEEPDPDPDPDPTGPGGCSPGYWRQEHHYDDWTGLSPDDLVAHVLGVEFEDEALADLTLGDAVALGGGDLNALLRHTIAALLNAANEDVEYPYTSEEIITMFQEAFASGEVEELKDMFDEANNTGCPLGNDEDDEDDPDELGSDDPEQPTEEAQVTLCHIPPGNPGNAHLITVGESAVPAHLAHGDELGACPPPPADESRNNGNGNNGNGNQGGGGKPENPGKGGKK